MTGRLRFSAHFHLPLFVDFCDKTSGIVAFVAKTQFVARMARILKSYIRCPCIKSPWDICNISGKGYVFRPDGQPEL